MYLQAFENSFISSASRIEVTITFEQINLNNFFESLIDFFDIPEILWSVDDIWLSGNFTRQGRGIWASNKIKMPVHTGASDVSGLADTIIEGHDRNKSDMACISYFRNMYGIWE